ncbi:MAG: hypothetical protein N2117_08025 [Anaerolineales bacterium]|nr:hypothetical protein [Anaerolineales bacterium]MCX7755180.1 hypothetical protein [Anaerolineales bacterium]MDW8278779.1 hypothetical protein [Anaerolineales bacterium]
MDSTQAHWPAWIDSLRRRKLDGLALWLLESVAPLRILTAQILYVVQPLVLPQTGHQLNAIARLLEQDEETHAFADILKGQQQ